MPYDVTIHAKGAGTKEVKYTVTHARSNVDLTGAEMEERIDACGVPFVSRVLALREARTIALCREARRRQ